MNERERKHSKKRIPGYIKPKKPRCHHIYGPDSKGVRRCTRCGKLPIPRAKAKDPKDKIRATAHTRQRRMPPPKRGH